jgi:hypothetical protein
MAFFLSLVNRQAAHAVTVEKTDSSCCSRQQTMLFNHLEGADDES